MNNIFNIEESFYNQGSGGVHVFKAVDIMDLPELERRVEACKNSIDPYRSPSVSREFDSDGALIVKIKYYGLD